MVCRSAHFIGAALLVLAATSFAGAQDAETLLPPQAACDPQGLETACPPPETAPGALPSSPAMAFAASNEAAEIESDVGLGIRAGAFLFKLFGDVEERPPQDQ